MAAERDGNNRAVMILDSEYGRPCRVNVAGILVIKRPIVPGGMQTRRHDDVDLDQRYDDPSWRYCTHVLSCLRMVNPQYVNYYVSGIRDGHADKRYPSRSDMSILRN